MADDLVLVWQPPDEQQAAQERECRRVGAFELTEDLSEAERTKIVEVNT